MKRLSLPARCLALLLAAALFCLPASAEAPVFRDVPETHWAREAISALSEEGLLVGVGDGCFAPEGLMTRAQFLTMLVRELSGAALPEAAEGEPWYAPALAQAEELLLTECLLSTEDEALESGIERCEVAALLVLAMLRRGDELPDGGPCSYTDSGDIPGRYADAVASVRGQGLMGGYPDGSFRPHGTLTRAEAAVVVRRLIDAQYRLDSGAGTFENFVLLGDSLIANPQFVSQTFTRHGHQVLAAGGATVRQFFGVTTGGVYVGVEQWGARTGTLVGREFNGVVLLVGTNDLGGADAAEVCARLDVLLSELNNNLEQPVFVLELFPVHQRYQSRSRIPIEERNAQTAQINAWLRDYCADRPGLWCIDATEGFVDENGELIHCTDDGIHMSPAYYETFYENIARGVRSAGSLS